MKLSELMEDFTIDPLYKGEVMADDYVLAIDVSAEQNADVDDYAVVQEHIAGVDSALSAETNEKQYIRGGKSSSKKSTQRTFGVEGDKYIGDEFQDYVDSHEIKYGVGSKVVVNYVYFCLLNGVGEKGKVMIATNKDGGGNAGDNAGISINLSKNGAAPTKYTYSKA